MSYNPNVNPTAEMIALVPYAAEAEPKESLVICDVSDGNLRAIIMVDLPRPGHQPQWIVDTVKMLAEAQVDIDHMVLIFYTDRTEEEKHDEECTCPPLATTASLLANTCHSLLGIHIFDVAWVSSDGWWSMNTEDISKRSLEEINDTVTKARMVYEGRTIKTEVTLPPCLATASKSMRIDNIAAAIGHVGMDGLATNPHVVEARALWEKCLAQDHGPSVNEALRLLAYFQREQIRDRLMVDVLTTDDSNGTIAQAILGVLPEPLILERYSSAMALMTNILQWADDKHRPPVLVALAWVEWSRGKAHKSGAYLELAKPGDKSRTWYILSGKVDKGVALSAAIPPII